MRFRIVCLMLSLAGGVTAYGADTQEGIQQIRPGDTELEMPFLGSDTVDGYRIVADNETHTSTTIRTTRKAVSNGLSVLLIDTDHISIASGDTTHNHLVVDPNDLSLIRHDVRSPHDSGSVTCDADGHIVGWTQPRDGDRSEIDTVLGYRVFPDDGIGPWLLGLLPYDSTYSGILVQFNMWLNEERHILIRVTGTDELSAGGFKVPCWQVAIRGAGGPPGYRQTRWVSQSSHRLVRREAVKGFDDPRYVDRVRHPY